MLRFYLLLGLCGLSLVYAQTLSLGKRNSLSFNPNQQDYIEALLCQGCNGLESFVTQGLEIVATNPQGLSAYVRRNAFLPTAKIHLEARYNGFDAQNNLLTSTDWLEISEKPQALFSDNSDFTITADYRLVITGEELAGTYQTSVVYSLGPSTVRHELIVHIPEVTVLRVGSKVTSGITTISFNYQGPNAVDYVRAIQNSTPLALTGSNLEAVEVFSNSPKGYIIILKLFEINSPSPLDLRLFNKPIDGQTLQSGLPTDGFQTLITEDNFSLFVDGSEEPGDYRYTLEYNSQSNP